MSDTNSVEIQVNNEYEDFLRIVWWGSRTKLLFIVFGVVAILFIFSVFAALSEPSDPNDDRRWIIYAVAVVVPIIVVASIYSGLRGQAKRLKESSVSSTMRFYRKRA